MSVTMTSANHCLIWRTILVSLLTACYCIGKDESIIPRVKITSMHVKSTVVARLAHVFVTTQVKNYENISQEITFTFQLPENAFISNFSMKIADRIIPGIVKEKAEANKIYKKSKQQGVSAAKIDREDIPNREMKLFTVTVNTAAKSKAVFKLQYHELLQRRLGIYKQRISFQPNQIVSDLVFKAKIYEQEGISEFQYTLPGTNITTDSTIVKASNQTRELYFKPSVQNQAAQDQNKGISGEIVLSYDVERDTIGGIILQEKDYFVHYLAPRGITVLNKNIVFVIDISGSMSGLKMDQTRNAMLAILDQLHVNDFFNILIFDNDIKVWFSEPMSATAHNIREAKTFIRDKLHARGLTNINSALLRSIISLNATQGLGGPRGNIIVFLTDGRPTAGTTNTKTIRQSVTRANNHRFSLFSLGFGFDVDMPFLKAISWENGGFARRIYEENDASKQLENFYNELQDPTLLDVKIIYHDNAVQLTSLTRTSFPQYFKGSEIIIAGKIAKHSPSEWRASVTGRGANESINAETRPTAFQNNDDSDETLVLEKLWAYMKINDLLKETVITDDTERKLLLKNETLALSLKYNFVTPLTSMVVSELLTLDSNDESFSATSHKFSRNYKVADRGYHRFSQNYAKSAFFVNRLLSFESRTPLKTDLQPSHYLSKGSNNARHIKYAILLPYFIILYLFMYYVIRIRHVFSSCEPLQERTYL